MHASYVCITDSSFHNHVVSLLSLSFIGRTPLLQIGRGPFAPSATGMVKIGELMTMVVAVEGAPNTDILA
ncbi:hypothetical protein SK128_021669 [Halocaridina rubra]|uniref:Uncharacterized protein n=1 Tax=Halocaridina rubra TaxID=373956 RepID=A0AAN9A3D7_HALRR